jgi:IS4 transposase
MWTNLSEEDADASQIAAIYRARWAVEIQFRAWKQTINRGKDLNRKSNEHHLQALVLAGIIAH